MENTRLLQAAYRETYKLVNSLLEDGWASMFVMCLYMNTSVYHTRTYTEYEYICPVARDVAAVNLALTNYKREQMKKGQKLVMRLPSARAKTEETTSVTECFRTHSEVI
jgi:hypothetical protein